MNIDVTKDKRKVIIQKKPILYDPYYSGDWEHLRPGYSFPSSTTGPLAGHLGGSGIPATQPLRGGAGSLTSHPYGHMYTTAGSYGVNPGHVAGMPPGLQQQNATYRSYLEAGAGHLAERSKYFDHQEYYEGGGR